MKLKKVYHMGIPVNDIDRAREFYTKVLGMQFLQRVGGNPGSPDALEIHGMVPRLDSLQCGQDQIVLFERPRPIQRDVIDEDGILHQAFDMDLKDYGDALKTIKDLGRFHRTVERRTGKTIYFFDTEGNYLELRFAPD